ncbi:MAG: hypothetical protein NVSMB12_19390 [Acidimicrobiales bacterium]
MDSAPLADRAVAWLSRHWDDDAAMLWNPPGSFDRILAPHSAHLVPPTVWYAIALAARGDAARATRAVRAVLACQLDEPGTPWHGTFARFKEFPAPRPGAIEFVGYDPNWRQFVGTGLSLALLLAPDAFDAATRTAMVDAIRLAVDGEPPTRVTASYTNIALLKAWLDVHAGCLLDRPDLVARGESLAESIAARFAVHDTFDEWNSPTYYGIDLLALALWRDRSPSGLLRTAGARMEAALWTEIAASYHAGLRNVAGPYTRAYGMDMARYVAGVGVWIKHVVGAEAGPLPDLDHPFTHSHDLTLAPVAALVGTHVPEGVSDALRSFAGTRRLERVVGAGRIATAWMDDRLMIGAERGGQRWSGWAQYHPATVHWAEPSGRTRWIRLVHAGPVEARTGPAELHAACGPHPRRGRPEPTFLVSAAGAFSADRWELPGLTVEVRTNASFVGAPRAGDLAEVRYRMPPTGDATFELSFTS